MPCYSGAQEVLDGYYESWAKALLGSPAWRSGVIASGELGWTISGFHRAVLDVAKHRARLFLLPREDMYASAFRNAHDSASSSWASRSLCLLNQLGIPDFPVWLGGGGDYKGYCARVRQLLVAAHLFSWRAAVAKHALRTIKSATYVPCERIVPAIPSGLAAAIRSQFPWQRLHKQLSLARLRAGLVDIGHLAGRRSRARAVQCIWCDDLVSKLWAHVFGEFQHWCSYRSAVCIAMNGNVALSRTWDIMFATLSAAPGDAWFFSCLDYVDAVVASAETFWRDL